MWFFRSRGTVQRLRQETDAEEHRRVLFEIGGTARTLFGKDKKKKETRYRAERRGSLFPHQPKTTNLNEP